MKKSIFLTISVIVLAPYFAYLGLQAIDPAGPDVVYVKRPSLFAGKWEKTGNSNNFTEYVDKSKLEVNLDATINIVSMRNYFKVQLLDDDDDSSRYKSQVSHETVDCFNQTIIVNKRYFLADNFAAGSLIEDPIELISKPIQLREQSVGLSKVKAVCKIANQDADGAYVKSSFMNNI